jgi:hypothetical protein
MKDDPEPHDLAWARHIVFLRRALFIELSSPAIHTTNNEMARPRVVVIL